MALYLKVEFNTFYVGSMPCLDLVTFSKEEKSMMKLKYVQFAILAAVFTLGPVAGAMAADGAQLFQDKTCWSCHGKDAKTPILPIYPRLAGQNAEYAFNQMKDIKNGVRTNGQTAAMKGIMATVSEDEMRAIADWLATQ